MASSLTFTTLFFFFFFSTSLLISVSSHQFHVEWALPSHNQSYNLWATLNRFHINDSLHFDYYNDSVLVVNYTNYRDCITSDPIMHFEGGNANFVFDRFGYFYFISGRAGNCQSGQKMVVRVMVHPLEGDAPSYPPAEMRGEGVSRTPSLNSGNKGGYVFYFVITAIFGVFVVLCLFM